MSFRRASITCLVLAACGGSGKASDGILPDAPDVPADACVPATGGGGTINFDQFAEGTVVKDQFTAMGIVFSSAHPSGGLHPYNQFTSPASPPTYVTGDDETTDVTPGPEFGNDVQALPITLTFVDPSTPANPGTTTSVGLREIFTNIDNVVTAKAFDPADNMVDMATATGDSLSPGKLLELAAPAIRRVTIEWATTPFEDNAGIDDVTFAPVTVVCP